MQMETTSNGLHPLALGLGFVLLLALVLVVLLSSYRRDRLQYMAWRLLRKKRATSADKAKQSEPMHLGSN